ncbi:MAG TPA: Tm-1-like ATP-binding domain-containing protein [Candidatus Limnocylindrales bacterium]|nr:Tm-1-like ATP-binding domain-containing protein [Candidatus Limnocylindrales bacterium]
MAQTTILLIGTLDTKGDELAYVRDLIVARGHTVLTLDAGTGEPAWTPDIGADRVATAGGGDLAALREANDRAAALDVMCRGVRAVALELLATGDIGGVIGMGGSGGTAIATSAMRAMPVGLPKVMVSTMASGDVSAYVDVKDITMMPSVVDVSGLNRLSRRILANAAGAVCGMAEQQIPPAEDRPLITATMFGVTTPCVTRLRERLEATGYEVLIFHAVGSGGRAMESLIADGFVTGVADVTTTELADELIGGLLSAGPDRLGAAARAGLPQVVSVGALDMCNWAGMETVPERFRDRTLYKHNPQVTLMRTTPAENAELGRILAEKLNAATGPVALYLPLRGVSMIDADGMPFWSPEADAALFDAIRAAVDPAVVELVELDLHINDPAFADAMTNRLIAMLAERAAGAPVATPTQE